MRKIMLLVSAACLFGPRAQCETSKPADPNYEAGPPKFVACSLLEAAEIQKLTGSSIEQSKSSGHLDGKLRISQCVYLASQPNKSVSLVVTETDSRTGIGQTARDLWLERFGPYRGRQREKKEETEDKKKAEEEREARPPLKIRGLGEEAFWTAGSLYVLKKNLFVRLSIGGPDSEAIKLQHSKSLATLALKRL